MLLEHTTEALRLDPKNSFAQSDMGLALLNQKQPAPALAHLQAALDSLPLTTEPQYKPQAIRYNLAQACMQLSRYTEAARHLQAAERLDPNNPETHYLLALALACQGGADNAPHETGRGPTPRRRLSDARK